MHRRKNNIKLYSKKNGALNRKSFMSSAFCRQIINFKMIEKTVEKIYTTSFYFLLPQLIDYEVIQNVYVILVVWSKVTSFREITAFVISLKGK